MRRKIKVFLNQPKRDSIILNQIKENNDIIYGARSIKAQLGLFGRPTQDWDIFTKNPKESATKIDKKLDNQFGFDYHYIKKGMHKGTYKVKGRGYDLKKGTKDDESVVDYSPTPRPAPKIIIINGIQYRRLTQEEKAKRKSLADKEFEFRHKKDRTDLQLIQSAKKSFNPRINNVFNRKK